jgi:hypothetical protein
MLGVGWGGDIGESIQCHSRQRYAIEWRAVNETVDPSTPFGIFAVAIVCVHEHLHCGDKPRRNAGLVPRACSRRLTSGPRPAARPRLSRWPRDLVATWEPRRAYRRGADSAAAASGWWFFGRIDRVAASTNPSAAVLVRATCR